MFNSTAAAAYMGITVETLYYHRKRGRLIEDQKVGPDLLFRKATLDRFRASLPTRGRQPSGADATKVAKLGKASDRWAAMLADKERGKTLQELADKYGYGDITAVSRALSRARVARVVKATKTTKTKAKA